MEMKPQAEHRWFESLLGEWTYESNCPAMTGQADEVYRGTESVRSLGGLWYVAESHGTMPDGDPAIMIATFGYDPAQKQYVGTWIGSMMPKLWIYEGSLDPTGKILTLECEGPNMMNEGETAKYHDIIELVSSDERKFTSQMQDPEGNWQTLVTMHYSRKR